MGNITAKELKRNTGEILRRVRVGGRFTITHRGKPVAVLAPPGEGKADAPDGLRPFDEAWGEIEATLQKSKPAFRKWREAVAWTRSRRLS